MRAYLFLHFILWIIYSFIHLRGFGLEGKLFKKKIYTNIINFFLKISKNMTCFVIICVLSL